MTTNYHHKGEARAVRTAIQSWARGMRGFLRRLADEAGHGGEPTRARHLLEDAEQWRAIPLKGKAGRVGRRFSPEARAIAEAHRSRHLPAWVKGKRHRSAPAKKDKQGEVGI